ncbi:metallophosphoesterase [Rubrivivax gelatinosus]|uniref:metallophosphoesterase family protein n=1 Tax=Rubrivivax gelatinosus TaxID=28068 RepID=UPI001903C23E|nr:metallophosphoesterase [Rubrivivax gelatinosus]MBK1615898.1 metallophosphoesterase [Rubrivivax gelatinosus]MBZ8142929.1 metallophosphoesterase [Rubrivivax gelatinosus]
MGSVDTFGSIRLLHLSDLHQGIAGQEWMWPTLKTQFYDDLRGLHSRSGPWDLVIFSGDLTQRGAVEEFKQLSKLFGDLWAHFNALGSNPYLFVVPGNHDLARPDKMDAAGRVMAQWWSEEAIHEDFWGSPSSQYRKAVANWFENYESWIGQIGRVVPMLPAVKGLLPGDVSSTLEKDGTRLGLVGLNSAWLHHTSAESKGCLCVHSRQLMAVTSNDPDKWSAGHSSRLLVTHHPVGWLHSDAQADWASDINVPNRFDAHLFGHMHEARLDSNAVSGGGVRHSLQAASLFGLEYINDEVRREYGYLAVQIPISPAIRGMRIWPRTVRPRADGSRRLVANQLWELIEDSYCDIVFDGDGKPNTVAEAKGADPLAVIHGVQEVLARLTRPGSFNEAHGAVRKTEQSEFLAALRDERRAWLVTSWGLGGDEFIEGVQQQMLGRRGSIYYLDFHKYRTQNDLLAGLMGQIGCSFERLCSGLAEEGPAILVLDDLEIDAGSDGGDGGARIALQVPELVRVILDFCPELYVVVRSRVAPPGGLTKFVELKPLDEADTSTYLSVHPKGGSHLAKHDAVMRLHRHTDGVPSRIDATLRDLHIVGLKGVYELDSDVAGNQVESKDVSPALIRTIKDISTSSDELNTRSFALLKVLSMFPQGEQLLRVKRFFGSRAFYPTHASRLFDLGLVDPEDVKTLGRVSALYEQPRALVVRRPVREYIIQSLSDSEFRTLSAKALSIYFGDEWELKGIRTPTGLNFRDPGCDSREIGNACTMVLRATAKAIETGSAPKIRSVLALATSFAAELRVGVHYRSIASMFDDILPLHERSGNGQELDLARLQHAISLRMIGEHARAHELLKQCEVSVKSKSMRQEVLLNLAHVGESMKADPKDVVEVARRAEAIDPKSNYGLQARGVAIANDGTSKEDRDAQLHLLQEEALKRRAFVVYNNLAIKRAERTPDAVQKKQLLQIVSQTARKENDPYNLVRASLGLAGIELEETGGLGNEMLRECTRAYEYLYNQRMDSLFNNCHGVLWRAFKAKGDIDNMLTLFRHSSLVWRLRGQDGVERGFIEQLIPLIRKRAGAAALNADRKFLYFMTRSIQIASCAAPVVTNSAAA